RTGPTGSPPSVADSRSGPPPARAPPSPGTSPSPLARQRRPAHEACDIRAKSRRPGRAIAGTHETSAQPLVSARTHLRAATRWDGHAPPGEQRPDHPDLVRSADQPEVVAA